MIDPETGLDGVRSVGIRNGRIAAISRTPLQGRTVLDATGLVVAPGFIDLHAHGQDLPAARMQAFDGVTTALELEQGTLPVTAGVRYNSVIEPQSSFEAIEEIVSLAAATGAHMHINHLNSTSTRDIARIGELVRGAQGRGLEITTEAYTYGAGSTVVGAELFRGNWRERWGGATAGDIELAGVPFNDSTLAEAQAKTPGEWIIAHFMRPERSAADREYLDQSVLLPGGAIASDAMPWTSKGQTLTGDVWPLPADAFAHPRSAGTFTRFLRDFVRERRKVSLQDGLRRMTLIPAQILEQSAPAMKRKGRVQVGADADLVAFDLATVSDRGTYTRPNQTSVGMRHVIVNGTAVIRDGALVRDALPGRAIRRAENRSPR